MLCRYKTKYIIDTVNKIITESGHSDELSGFGDVDVDFKYGLTCTLYCFVSLEIGENLPRGGFSIFVL